MNLLKKLTKLEISSFFPLFLCTTLVLYLVSPSLNPFNAGMFGFQDPTQVGRITSFSQSLKDGQIPPRFAPEFSFGLGFPVFNFYAPTAYWISSLFVLIGFSSITALKLSFLLAILIAFWGMYFFLIKLLSPLYSFAALLGASVYVTSTYFATEIILRGNLAECWFLALLPLALGLLIHNTQVRTHWMQLLTTLVLALLFTSHNMMLLFAIPICFIFLLFFPQKLRNLVAFFAALLIDTYFLIPAFWEGSFVQAATIAKEYNYLDHFLCPWQLWKAQGWVLGGSLPGCNNPLEMSFKLGKLQIILGALGFAALLTTILKKKKITHTLFPILFFAVIFIGATFLTLEFSKPIWQFFSPIMSLFQFPWRFLVFSMFGVSVFSAYFFSTIKFPFQTLIVFFLIILLFIPARKYFISPLIPYKIYQEQYNSKAYFYNHLAYKMPEYIASGANLAYWRNLEPKNEDQTQYAIDPYLPVQSDQKFEVLRNSSLNKKIVFKESGIATLNIHYFPFWHIAINKQRILPVQFDQLHRPIIQIKSNDTMEIQYDQTTAEKIADLLSLIGISFAFATLPFLQKIGTL